MDWLYKQFVTASLSLFLAFIHIGAKADSIIVNINSRSSSPVLVDLAAGTYSVEPIGTADGGAFNAWRAWSSTNCSNPDGCRRTSPTTVTGWMNIHSVSTENLAAVQIDGNAVPISNNSYTVDDGFVYPVDIIALSKAQSSVFTLTDADQVSFFISDSARFDNSGGMSLRVTQLSSGGFAIDPQSIPTAIVLGEGVTKQFSTFFGEAPYAWSIVSGDVPMGLALSADGIFSGTPSKRGSSTFTVQVQDNAGAIAEKEFTVEVVLVLPPPDIRISKVGTTTVPGRNVDYFIVLENSGDTVSEDLEVIEYLDPRDFFEYKGASPAPDLVEAGFLFWSLPPIAPKEAKLLGYTVKLNEQVPLGSHVIGQVCAGPIGTTPDAMTQKIDELEKQSCVDCNWLFDDAAVGNYCYQAKSQCSDCKFIPFPFKGFCSANCINRSELCIQTALQCFEDLCGLTGATALASSVGPSPSADDTTQQTCSSDQQTAVRPVDPNEKLIVAASRRLDDGTILSYIQPDQLLTYPIHFENIGDIEALDVFVTDVLDPNLDDSTLELLTPDGGSYDPATRMVRWDLLNRNLLPGETGNVLLSIKPVPGLPSGTTIRNIAEIQFEIFETLATPEVVTIIDNTEPSCTVYMLPVETETEAFTISWVGEDAIGEIDTYTVFVSENGEQFAPLLSETKETETVFTGTNGSTYHYFCVAKDTAGNVEQQELVAEATTTVISNRPPIAQCQNVTVPADAETCTATSGSVDNGSYDSDDDPITITQSPPGPYGLGDTTVTITVTDDSGAMDSCSAQVSVVDNTPPLVVPQLQESTQCMSPSGTPIMLGTPTVSDACDSSPAVTNDAPVTFSLGTTTVTWSAKDAASNVGTATQVVTVIDAAAPTIDVSVSPDTLSPPNHKMVPIATIVTANDVCDATPSITLSSVMMDEGDETNTYDPAFDNTIGDGNTVNDIIVDENGSISLRSERSGTGDGRVYTITYDATDASGNTTSASATVTVPHNQ